MKITGLIFLFFLTLRLHGQEGTLPDSGSVVIQMPVEVEALLERHRDYIKKVEGIPGYRIHVAMASTLREIRKAKEDFDAVFGEEFDSEVVFYPPRYRLVVGNYRDKLSAYHDLLLIREAFPKAFLSKSPIDILAP